MLWINIFFEIFDLMWGIKCLIEEMYVFAFGFFLLAGVQLPIMIREIKKYLRK